MCFNLGSMKANRLAFLLLLSAATFEVPAQQTEADRKLFEKIKANAERGDAQSQFDLGEAFDFGYLGVAKDEVEAVRSEERRVGKECRSRWSPYH